MMNNAFYKVMNDAVLGARVLHVGCVGTRAIGANNFPLHRFLTKRARGVYGIDIDAEGIAQMAALGFACEATPAESYFCSEHYDVVTVSSVLQFVASPIGVITNLARSLKPGGIMLVEVPNAYSLIEIMRNATKFAKLKPIQLTGQSTLGEVNLFSSATLAALIIGSGLELISVKSYVRKTARDQKNLKLKIRTAINNFPRYLSPAWGPTLLATARKIV
ncbi:MAG: methyltransferase domain-containing protein [Candidatus Magasanikbacteria bacterium]|nr:methyltransferase domain-containing protein [Candidatus Magasanikbacteria bacterium]